MESHVEIKSVGVVGAGQMGNGIAHVFALSGYDVLLNDISQEALDRGLATIRKNLERHARPSARWLLDDGELRQVPGLRTLHHHEDWNAAGRHEVSWVGERSR